MSVEEFQAQETLYFIKVSKPGPHLPRGDSRHTCTLPMQMLQPLLSWLFTGTPSPKPRVVRALSTGWAETQQTRGDYIPTGTSSVCVEGSV